MSSEHSQQDHQSMCDTRDHLKKGKEDGHNKCTRVPSEERHTHPVNKETGPRENAYINNSASWSLPCVCDSTVSE